MKNVQSRVLHGDTWFPLSRFCREDLERFVRPRYLQGREEGMKNSDPIPRVLRGGSGFNALSLCRLAYRPQCGARSQRHHNNIGFRVVRMRMILTR